MNTFEMAVGAFALAVVFALMTIAHSGARSGISNDCDAIGAFRVDGKAYTCERKP